jgi:hypothetical protein
VTNHFSGHFGLNISGHVDIDFIDINLNTDTHLYLDPCLLEGSADIFSKDCTEIINSFFDKIFDCCEQHDLDKLYSLLEFAHEPNETKLGISQNQSMGRGTTAEALFAIYNK